MQWYGENEHECGYCKDGISKSNGMHAHHPLSVQDYQDLVDRGWRRSGQYLYKMRNTETCCPTHSIRLEVSRFQPSKKHKQTSSRLERFLNGQYAHQTASLHHPGASSASASSSSHDHNNIDDSMSDYDGEGASRHSKALIESKKHAHPTPKTETEHAVHDILQNAMMASSSSLLPNSAQSSAAVHFTAIHFDILRSKTSQFGDLSTSIALKIASFLSHLPADTPAAAAVEVSQQPRAAEHSASHSKQKSSKSNFDSSYPKKIAEKICHAARSDEKSDELIDRMEIAPNGFINIFLSPSSKTKFQSEKDALLAHQKQLDAAAKAPPSAPKHSLTLEVVRSAFSEESYQLYRKYQMAVHHDPPEKIKPKSYTRFLCDSPLKHDPNGPMKGYGSFHMLYRVDGKLIAVGVVDILPKCLSSVYLFYDPDYGYLAPGVVTALKEIQAVQEQTALFPQFKYYYLGFYIHSCHKMRYKAQFQPSELLCPVTYAWVPIDRCLPILDEVKTSRFATDEEVEQQHVAQDESVAVSKGTAAGSTRLVAHGTQTIQFRETTLWRQRNQFEGLMDIIGAYRRAVGPILAHRLPLVLSG